MHRRWILKESDPRARDALSRALGVSPLVASVLAARQLSDPDNARAFLSPNLVSLPDPEGIPGMAAAADRLVRAAHAGETVWVYTDYDVDGVTSAALLSEFFRESRIRHQTRLPRRDREGYGINAAALQEVADQGGTVVVTADTGISSVAEARFARELGLDLVITDHHTPGPELPDAVALVNPKLPGSTYPDAMIAGVGVAWNLAASVRRRLRESGWYEGHKEPDVRELLDLVALGTVADVAPLSKVNRALVTAGLKRLNGDRQRSGLQALKQIAGVKGALRAAHIGFQLGPRLNAAGRMEGPHEALDLLLSADPGLSRDLAARLDALNRKRQDEERGILDEAVEQVKREGWMPGAWSLVVGGAGWHEGVIGIVASRLAELHYRPSVVLALPQGKGSARSIPGLNLYETLGDCAALLDRFGGHAAAAGLKLAPENLGAFRYAFDEAVRRRISEDDLRPLLVLDAEVSFRDMGLRAVGELALLEPFGSGNPSPTLLASRVGVLDVRPIGREGEHLRFRLEQNGTRVDAVAWRKAEGLAHVRPRSMVDVAFTPQVNEWNGADRGSSGGEWYEAGGELKGGAIERPLPPKEWTFAADREEELGRLLEGAAGPVGVRMIKKIRVEDLQVGMFVDDFNVPWMEHPFLTSKRLIRKAKEIQILVDQRVLEVYIDTERGKDSPTAWEATEAVEDVRRAMAQPSAEPEAAPEEPRALPETASFEEELRRAKNIYGEAKSLVQDLLHDARMGKSVDGERAAAVVDEMVDSIFRNQDALSSLSRLKNFDDYTFHHSVNVSVLSLTLGRHLGLVKGELRRLGIGAILHDIGKMRVPEEILNKPGKLTEEEFSVVRTHTLHGAKILMQTPALPEDCSTVALNHHERFNGKGYPRGLAGLKIGKFGLISAIADVYDAVTSDRVYHKGMPSYQAVQKVYEWTKTDFYPIYVQKFIQCLGIFPIGSAVRLDTGEVGVVCGQNHDQLLRPWVRLVRGGRGEPVARIDVDLRVPDARGEKPFARSVAAAMNPADAGLDVEELLLGEPSRAAA